MKYIGLVAILLFAFSVPVMAQGTSPVAVTGISVSPDTFKAGDQVTVTIRLKNNGTRSYGCSSFKASVYIFKAAPYTTTNQVWQASQALPSPMAAGATQSVTFTSKWLVPNANPSSYHVMAWSPVCAPDEFGQSSVIEIDRECVYKYSPLRTIRQIREPMKVIKR
jgi:hypothetical protein